MYDASLHHRKSIRLKGYDYSQSGLYFITICCHNNQCRFGKIINGEMQLNEFGLIAAEEWEKLPDRYSNTELDVYQIMPNHLHGIVHIIDVGAIVVTQPEPTCNDMIGAYKSIVFNACLEVFKSKNQIMGKLWQRNFYEHIIRNGKSYTTISNYIINNPATWNSDKFYLPDGS